MTQKIVLGLALSALFALPAGSAPAKDKKKAADAPAAPVAGTALKIEAAQLRALKARSLGPAVMGGRVSDIALDPESPSTFYVGFSTGGLFKTVNDGTTWDALFEKESVHSIGAVAVAPSDPKTIWVGTGEASDRNTAAWGNGVHLSTDAGETWKNVGLGSSRAIARIVVDAKDPKSAWVAAIGDLWAWGGERGLYRTTDAGASWKRVLAGPQGRLDRAGCGDVAVDPADANVVYAALYARRRQPWSFVSGPDATDGNDDGGIFRSTDAGATWKKLGGGLPKQTGRIGLSVSRKNPKVVLAVVQSLEGGPAGLFEITSKHGGVFRSEDGGETWTRTSKLDPRPFYFSQIRVDPENDKRVYLGGFSLHVSDDGGASFREDLYEKVHPDIHAITVDPRNPKRVLLGNDGGVYESLEGGKNWRYLNNVAAGEFYRVSLDASHPFRICGGLQDNYSWVGPSATRTKDGILNSDWVNLGGGDGFGCAFDPSDPNVVYFESQGASVTRLDLVSGESKRLRPEAGEGQPSFRFHWNSPLVASRKGTLLLGGNRVLRLSERGTDWKTISPELVAHDPERMHAGGSGAETFGTVYTISESPLADGLLWAGTDDGKLWVTEDDGGKWTEVTGNLPAAARGHWVSRVEAGRHDASAAYVAIDGHRTGTLAPLVYATRDKGKSWQSIAGNLPADGPVHLVREDAKNPALLYAGTEYGLYASFDRGVSWARFGDLPTVAVDDIQVHPETLDMVVATHGRSLYMVDDVRPLQALTPDLAKEELHLFPPPPAFGFYPLPGVVSEAGKGVFHGDNPPEGAMITFWVGAYTGEPVSVTIANASSQTVAKLKPAGVPGLNRVTWDLKPTKDYLMEYGGLGTDKFVPQGEYTVTLSRGKVKLKEKLHVAIAPGIETR